MISTRMATTPKTLEALVVRVDSLVESPAESNLDPPIDPRNKLNVDNLSVIKACPLEGKAKLKPMVG